MGIRRLFEVRILLVVVGRVRDGRVCKNSDSVNARTLTTEVSVEGGQYDLTVEKCVDQCINYGFTRAGVELGQQCCTQFLLLISMIVPLTNLGLQGCGNSTNGGQEIEPSNCMMACSGDSTEICGGPNALTYYLLDSD